MRKTILEFRDHTWMSSGFSPGSVLSNGTGCAQSTRWIWGWNLGLIA